MKHVKLFEQFVNEKKGDTYEYGCVMLYFDFPQINEIHSKINEDDLYTEEEDRTYGLENEPHVTLLYGLHEEVTLDQIKNMVSGFKFGDIRLHNPSLFENQYDVLKFDVATSIKSGETLCQCNKALTELPHTTSFPDYHPHCTIAYIKKGLGKKYVEMMEHLAFDVTTSHMIYSMTDGSKVRIPIK
jgi:2'-5' RNA ligase